MKASCENRCPLDVYGRHESAVTRSTTAAAPLTAATPANAANRLAPIGTDVVLLASADAAVAVDLRRRPTTAKADDRAEAQRLVADRSIMVADFFLVSGCVGRNCFVLRQRDGGDDVNATGRMRFHDEMEGGGGGGGGSSFL